MLSIYTINNGILVHKRQQSERWTRPSSGEDTTGKYDPKFHSANGLVSVSISGQPLASDVKIARAIEELSGGFSFDPDPNDGTPLGIGTGRQSPQPSLGANLI
jgi:hypothetical protein